MKGFCVECWKEFDVETQQRMANYPVMEIEVEICEKYLICPICGSLLSNNELLDENLNSAYEKYKIIKINKNI